MRAVWRAVTSHRGSTALYAIGCVVLLILYSSWGRPIWYDEMVYFALGGFHDTGSALSAIRESTTNLNQGVTGVYAFSQVVSTTLFGAHHWALRLPSLLFAAYYFGAAYVFVRVRRLGPLTLISLPIIWLGYPTFLYYAGEARTYMPLAAAVMGLLAYYSVPVTSRSGISVRLLGWSAALIGVLFHPYIALYWPALLVFTLVIDAWTRHARVTWRSAITFANPVLVVVGAVGFLTIGVNTWMRGKADTPVAWDTWLHDPLPVGIAKEMLQPFMQSWPAAIAGLALAGLALSVRAHGLSSARPGSRSASVIPPITLLALAWVLALAVSGISIATDFWVFPRQWIGSVALAAPAVVWLAHQSLLGLTGRTRTTVVAAWSAILIVALPGIITTGMWKASQIHHWVGDPSPYDALTRVQFGRELDSGKPLEQRRWIEFAEANLRHGGPVWPEFARYYTDTDWTTFTFVTDPSQLSLEQ